jgi:predicted anti-sigma-YlaC factor YlaD
MTNAGTMACRELAELVTEYLEGTLSVDDEERFQAHLQICPPCRLYLEQIRLTIAALGRLEPAALPVEECERLLTVLRGSLATKSGE